MKQISLYPIFLFVLGNLSMSGATVIFDLTGSTNDFSVEMTVTDLSVVVTDTSNITGITVTGFGSVNPSYYGSNASGYVNLLQLGSRPYPYFSFYSLGFYENRTQSWDSIGAFGPFAVNSEENFEFNDGSSSISATEGSFTVSVVPEPESFAALLSIFCVTALMVRRRR